MHLRCLPAAALAAFTTAAPVLAATHVGQLRVLPRDGHIVIAVDAVESADGFVDVVVIAETRQSVEPFEGHALVELSDAGLRVVATEPKLRLVFSIARPRAIHTQSGAGVRVLLSNVEALPLEPPTALGRQLLRQMFDRFGTDPDMDRLRERFLTNDEGGDGPRDCVGEGETERCEEPPVEEPPGGGGGDPGPGGGARKCEQPCLYGKCNVTCYYPASPVCKCSENPRGYPLCACV